MTRPSTASQNPPAGGLLAAGILAAGTFAVGTDAFVVTGFLPEMAESLDVSTSAAGQSLTAFAITYAVLAPVLTSLTSRVPRRALLVSALLLLGVANVLTALSPNLGVLIVSRILAATGAAVFTPNAGSVAAILVRPELRGRALAIVISGLTIATAIGVPLGLLASQWLGWRMAIGLVAVLAMLAALGVRVVMPPVAGSPGIPLRQRLAVLNIPSVRAILPLTWLGMGASYTPYVYSVSLMRDLDIGSSITAVMLFLYGAGAFIGVTLSGYGTDRRSPGEVLAWAYGVMAVALAGLATLLWLELSWVWAVALCMLLWGGSSWSQTPPQQHRLFAAAPEQAPLLVALNAAGIYIGIGLGTLIGGLTIESGSHWPPLAGTLIALGALAFLGATRHRLSGLTTPHR